MPDDSKEKTLEDKKRELSKLVSSIRKRLKGEASIVEEQIDAWRKQLKKIDKSYRYEAKKYPDLKKGRIDFPKEPKKDENFPQNPAEALLWKQGDWLKYRKFLKWGSSKETPNPPARIVQYAFALYLKDMDGGRPIFDQHSLRALWAIRRKGRKKNGAQCCYKYLLSDEGSWKGTPGSGSPVASYDWYRKELEEIVNIVPIDLRNDFDKLLMPLGKALKKLSKPPTNWRITVYEEFLYLCGNTKKYIEDLRAR
jgi:hypothetical protein